MKIIFNIFFSISAFIYWISRLEFNWKIKLPKNGFKYFGGGVVNYEGVLVAEYRGKHYDIELIECWNDRILNSRRKILKKFKIKDKIFYLVKLIHVE